MPIATHRAALIGAVTLLGAATLTAAPAGAAPLVTDAPGVAAGNAQGPAPFRFYGTGGSRVQQVYEAPLFANFAGGKRQITALAFRAFPGAFPSLFFGTTLSVSDVTIRLSTTARGDEGPNVLSTRYADNVGADEAVVYDGALTLTTTAIGSFDYLLTLETPFVYDPDLGNLLLDVAIPTTARVSGTGILGFLTFDTVNTLDDGIASIVSISNGAATSGVFSTAGAVTRFFSDPVAVPAPGGLLLFALAGLTLGLARRMRREQ